MLLDVKKFIFHKSHRMAAVVVFVIIFSIDVATVQLLRLLCFAITFKQTMFSSFGNAFSDERFMFARN